VGVSVVVGVSGSVEGEVSVEVEVGSVAGDRVCAQPEATAAATRAARKERPARARFMRSD
jgi:hypothetical protein